MRKLWYKFNVWRYDRKVNKMCDGCFAFSPIICDGAKEMCPNLKLAIEKLCYYRNCYLILEEAEKSKNKSK